MTLEERREEKSEKETGREGGKKEEIARNTLHLVSISEKRNRRLERRRNSIGSLQGRTITHPTNAQGVGRLDKNSKIRR